MFAKQLQSRIDGLLVYLEPHWEFINCHMVNYLTDNHWMQLIPQSIKSEIQTDAHVQLAIETIFSSSTDSSQFPTLGNFLEKSRHHRLANYGDLLTSVEHLEQVLNIRSQSSQLSIKEFMSAKKCHEVEATAALVHKLIQSTQNECGASCYVVDAGDGKGYLSSRLALQYGHSVLGIDANESNTQNALSRDNKLQRAWNGLRERAELLNQGITPPRRGKRNTANKAGINSAFSEKYKTISRYITTELDLCNLLKEHFQQELENINPSICLTGLHTCGNLAATCLQVFHAQENCRILCNVGCCYHLLNERFSHDEFYGNKGLVEQSTAYGFPLSYYLRQRQLKLGRNARMLAAQSVERTLTTKELPNISLYYRALLEILVCHHAPHLKNTLQVGKVQRFNSFPEYVKKCAQKLNAPWMEQIEQAELDTLLHQYETDRHYLSLFYLLRMTFAPAVETVILLDRIMYLKELGYEQSYLIDLFDAVISPRHYAIVAIKGKIDLKS